MFRAFSLALQFFVVLSSVHGLCRFYRFCRFCGCLCRKFNGHSLRVNCVEHGASGDVLFTGGYDRLVVAHDLRARTEIQTLPICKDSVESLLVVGHDILASDANGCVYY